MNIVITGAAGYLGSSIVKRLHGLGGIIYAFDNLFYNQGTIVSSEFLKPNIAFFNEDVNDWSKNLVSAVKSADVIIPLAALVGAVR